MDKTEKLSQLNINIPDRLKAALLEQAAGTGTDITGVVLRALHEFLSEPLIRQNTALAVEAESEVYCQRCGNGTTMWAALQDDPAYLVCAPHCSDGPIDAHGAQIEVGDPVILYIGPGGATTGTILSFTVDGAWDEVATVQVPGARRTYCQATRKLQKHEI